MAKKEQLRLTRAGTVINTTSKEQEKTVIQALELVAEKIQSTYGVKLEHKKDWLLKDIVADLRTHFPDEEFFHFFDNTGIRPDGGILYLTGKDGKAYPLLISEVKNQGTNDSRLKEGLTKQAKGNAIERLGKNVIGLRTAFLHESVFPFICFGYGCDFEDSSSILDRVVTIAMFGKLNTTYLHSTSEGRFNRGSFYFREHEWSVEEMATIMYDIGEKTLFYYFSKYSKENFTEAESTLF
jgi:type II restriction enzyme